MLYVIYCEDSLNTLEKRRSVHKAHLKHLDELKLQERLLVAGSWLGDDCYNPIIAGFKGTLIIAEFANINEAKAWIAADPFVTAGIYVKISVHPFKRV